MNKRRQDLQFNDTKSLPLGLQSISQWVSYVIMNIFVKFHYVIFSNIGLCMTYMFLNIKLFDLFVLLRAFTEV